MTHRIKIIWLVIIVCLLLITSIALFGRSLYEDYQIRSTAVITIPNPPVDDVDPECRNICETSTSELDESTYQVCLQLCRENY